MEINFETEDKILFEKKVGNSRSTFMLNGKRVSESLFFGVLCDVETNGVLDPRWKGGKWKKVSSYKYNDKNGKTIYHQEWIKE